MMLVERLPRAMSIADGAFVPLQIEALLIFSYGDAMLLDARAEGAHSDDRGGCYSSRR